MFWVVVQDRKHMAEWKSTWKFQSNKGLDAFIHSLEIKWYLEILRRKAPIKQEKVYNLWVKIHLLT